MSQAADEWMRSAARDAASRAGTAPEPLGKPGGPGLFHIKGLGLPVMIQHVRNDLMEKRGIPESRATQMAIGIVRNWAHGHDGHGNAVHPGTVAQAVKAIAEYDRDRARAKATRTELAGRFNPNHAPPGAGGGQFTSSAGASGSGGRTPARAPAKAKAAAPVAGGGHERRAQLLAKAHADREEAHHLQHQLRDLEKQAHEAAQAAKKSHAAAQAAQKAGHAAHHRHHTSHHRRHNRHHHSLQHRIASLRERISGLLDQAQHLEKQAHAIRAAAAEPAGRAPMTITQAHDSDGLDASWDGDLSGLPDLAGLDVADFEALDPGDGEPAARAAKPGTGARFQALKAKLAAKGASDPGALAAHIGRRKYGRARFTALAAKARKGKAAMTSRSEIMRFYDVEDIHIVSRGQGDGSGRVVEAYAAVFGDAVPIQDGQGRYEEEIDPRAFDATLARISARRGGIAAAVRVLYNHGKTMEGIPAPEYQRPLGRPVEIRPDSRGLLTRTEYAKTPLGEEILELVRSGAITAQSFVGGIIRSDPELRGPGDRYRPQNGVLTRVRRLALGLREYGPVLYAAYPGAEVLGVRMGSPEPYDVTATDGGFTQDEETASDYEEPVTGGIPEEVHPSRDHAHRLWQIRYEEAAREAGIPLRSNG